MMWFSQRKPRRFEHRMIYADDRKKFLDDIEQRAKEELGMSERKVANTDFHAAFTIETSHLRRRGAGHGFGFLFIGMVLMALIAAIVYMFL